MKELKITDKAAIQAYNKTDAKGKTLLSDLFGNEVFKQKITDRVKTFEDACEVLSISVEDTIPTGRAATKALKAFAKLITITEALNEGWQPDWNDANQLKYYPWFVMSDGFSLNYYVNYCRSSDVGSRLCFKNKELALYAGKQFLEIYKDAFVL